MNTVTIGGKAGDGIKAAGKLFAKILNELGYFVFVLDDYPSLITGGHNFNKISFDKEELFSHYVETDVLVALDEKTIKKHSKELKKGGVILFDSNSVKAKGFGVPALDLVKQVGGVRIMRNVALLGALSFILGIDFKIVKKVLEKTYPKAAEKNVAIAKLGYNFAKENTKQIMKLKRVGKPKELMSGNTAVAYGAVKAGLDNYIAYPMTPATPILHYLAKNSDKFGVKVVQPENEIGVINMALGSAYAGAKTMIGTSGGGFALMNEALSLAGMSETPIVIAEIQRPGPSTGVPTYTSQADLNFVINAGHGEFPKIVVAPGTNEQAFYKSAEALYLAWKYQTPVIILGDKHLGESLRTIKIDEKKSKKAKAKLSKGGKNYKRYAMTKDGISPLAFPGMKGTVVKSSSYEHDEFGITTEEPEVVKKMQEKRLRKMQTIEKEIEKLEAVKVYGKGKNVIVTWGSSIGAVLEAAKSLKNVKIVQVIYMLPFPKKAVKKHLNSAKKVVCVEANATGQLANLIKLLTGIEIKNKVLKYDSREFDPIGLLKELKRWLK
ncbi:MAG: 2-oxoacid:acceptor oxidoreductase subunit alpha [Nanoarchaeota archaeon]|nr:2-oxoacid:acceptor oxidoreductase subunit alpha [Nanoarchaeota archaeon]